MAAWAITLLAAYAAGRLLGRSAPPAPPAPPASTDAAAARKRAAPPVAKPPPVARPATERKTVAELETAVRPAAEREAQRALDPRRVLLGTDPVQRAIEFAGLLKGLTAGNVRQILRALENLPKSVDRRAERNLLMDAWGRLGGAEAAEYAANLPEGPERFESLYHSLSGWADQDPAAAEKWARDYFKGAENPYLLGVIAGASRHDLAKAVDMLYSLPYSRVRGQAADLVVDRYSLEGANAMMNWAAGISDERLKAGISTRVAMKVAESDPRAAADWALQNAGDERQPYNVAMVVNAWSEQDPLAAMQWVAALPEGGTKRSSMETAAGAWVSQDQAAAEKWLTANPNAPGTDRARIQLAMRYQSTDPVRAMAWASTVSDTQTRDHILERLASRWQQQDPAAAAKFLQK